MLKHIKAFCMEEDGLGTVEIVLILVILIALALVFKERITSFFNSVLGSIKDQEDEFKLDSIKNEADPSTATP